jgi:hypothetical protein
MEIRFLEENGSTRCNVLSQYRLVQLRKMVEINHYILLPDQHLNPEIPEYEADVLGTRPIIGEDK